MTFTKILEEQKKANPTFTISVVPESLIEKKGFSNGMIEQTIKNNKLENLEILIAEELDEITKIKVLFHELGHAKDYKNRETELLSINLQKELFANKSEYYAFENSLEEAKNLFNNGRTDVLVSLINSIPKRKSDPMYDEAKADILKSKLWIECELLVQSIKPSIK